jgi:hypothetical protein
MTTTHTDKLVRQVERAITKALTQGSPGVNTAHDLAILVIAMVNKANVNGAAQDGRKWAPGRWRRYPPFLRGSGL